LYTEKNVAIENEIEFISRYHRSEVSMKGTVKKDENNKWTIKYNPNDLLVSRSNNDFKDITKINENDCK